MTWGDWLKIPWQKRNEIIAFYGLRRSQNVKVFNDGVEDDGIREQDLESIAHLSVEEVVALKPLNEPLQVGVAFLTTPEEEKSQPEPQKAEKSEPPVAEKPKRGRKTNAKKR